MRDFTCSRSYPAAGLFAATQVRPGTRDSQFDVSAQVAQTAPARAVAEADARRRAPRMAVPDTVDGANARVNRFSLTETRKGDGIAP